MLTRGVSCTSSLQTFPLLIIVENSRPNQIEREIEKKRNPMERCLEFPSERRKHGFDPLSTRSKGSTWSTSHRSDGINVMHGHGRTSLRSITSTLLDRTVVETEGALPLIGSMHPRNPFDSNFLRTIMISGIETITFFLSARLFLSSSSLSSRLGVRDFAFVDSVARSVRDNSSTN